MEQGLIINLIITAVCIGIMAIYFNRREKKIHHLTEDKLYHFKDQYLHHVAKRKVKEKRDIDKLKMLAYKLEEKHKQLLIAGKSNPQNQQTYQEEVNKILKRAEEKAHQIEEEVRVNSAKFLEEQKKEVQLKMVDLVVGVSKKVFAKSLTYDEHKALIEEALHEMEGEDES